MTKNVSVRLLLLKMGIKLKDILAEHMNPPKLLALYSKRCIMQLRRIKQ